MRFLAFLIVTIFAFSCSRGYYDTRENYYNYEESSSLIKELKDGVLVIQIPSERRKLALLKSLYLNETDEKKKEEAKRKYQNFKLKLSFVQLAFIKGTKKHFDFAEYRYLPDTLVKEVIKGERNNIFMSEDLVIDNSINVDTSKNIFILRSERDYDFLRIYKSDGSLPPDPFPHVSTVSTPNILNISWDEVPSEEDFAGIHKAIYILNSQLHSFHKEVTKSYDF